VNTSHHSGGAPDVFLKTASAVNVQREYRDANQRVSESWKRRKPKPLHWWFEQKDHYSWQLYCCQQQVAERKEKGEPTHDIDGVLNHSQRCLATITVKCERLFNQWNRCGGGQE